MKEIYTLMDCKPGRLYKRTYVELHHSDSEEKNKNEMLDAYMIFIDRKKNKKSKIMKGNLNDNDSSTSSTSSDSDMEDIFDSNDDNEQNKKHHKEHNKEHNKKQPQVNKESEESEESKSNTEMSGGELSYLSSSAHTGGEFSDSEESNNSVESSNKHSVTDENKDMVSTSISVNTEDINMVSDY